MRDRRPAPGAGTPASTGVERDLSIGAGDVRLAGSLMLPAPAQRSAGRHPTVLLLPGSGPLDRNSDHRRLRLYAQHALGHLAAAPEVDPARLAVVGHSEGALLAARLGAAPPGAGQTGQAAVRAVVLLAGSARPGAEVLAWQARAVAPSLPAPVRLLLRLLRTDLVERQRRTGRRLAATTTDVAWVGGARVNARWFREFLVWDPREDLRRLRVPVLAVTGAKDLQVDPGYLATVAALVPGEVVTQEVADLDHILRHAPGAPSLSSYRRRVPEPFDPRVAAWVGSWLAQQLNEPGTVPSGA